MDETLPQPPLPLDLDTNGDGAFTISDLKLWFVEVYFVPGDWLLWFVNARLPGVAAFLEVGADDYGGLLSAVLSGGAWLIGIIAVLIAYRGIRSLDELITVRIERAYREALRRARTGLNLLRYRLRGRRTRASKPGPIEVKDGLELSELEHALLVAHSQVEPPYALALSDAANAIGRGRHETQGLLERLAKLRLLDRSTGGAEDGESAYMLSRSGRALMLSGHRA